MAWSAASDQAVRIVVDGRTYTVIGGYFVAHPNDTIELQCDAQEVVEQGGSVFYEDASEEVATTIATAALTHPDLLLQQFVPLFEDAEARIDGHLPADRGNDPVGIEAVVVPPLFFTP